MLCLVQFLNIDYHFIFPCNKVPSLYVIYEILLYCDILMLSNVKK